MHKEQGVGRGEEITLEESVDFLENSYHTFAFSPLQSRTFTRWLCIYERTPLFTARLKLLKECYSLFLEGSPLMNTIH